MTILMNALLRIQLIKLSFCRNTISRLSRMHYWELKKNIFLCSLNKTDVMETCQRLLFWCRDDRQTSHKESTLRDTLPGCRLVWTNDEMKHTCSESSQSGMSQTKTGELVTFSDIMLMWTPWNWSWKSFFALWHKCDTVRVCPPNKNKTSCLFRPAEAR